MIYLFSLCLVYFFFFFFQAEDGIRDLYVTGVQTCALPILFARLLRWSRGATVRARHARRSVPGRNARPLRRARAVRRGGARSEEHTSELQSRRDLVCRLLLEKKKKQKQ